MANFVDENNDSDDNDSSNDNQVTDIDSFDIPSHLNEGQMQFKS